jgi:hypothetical protein
VEPASPRAWEARTNGASLAEPRQSRIAQPGAAPLDQVHLSPDPLAVTDRYKLAAPYSSSSLDL